ncbi:uncharacterized protein PpBr36_11299 [Pyricularia pennisetigena]|uniref:uncharacterized protein n=1 Tax=Pyricularia pennisetigena TaxID=1578925 RepID=UPI00114FCCC7|nr:uncharacterized protein PpBr36_11299 [Pyricularia pennisetigena]TLS20589.1 hypothetical protein PpBr36_11299 [Pyricularia pennisetigena]
MRTSTFLGVLSFFAVGITAIPIGCDSSAIERRGDSSRTIFQLPEKGGEETEHTFLPLNSHCAQCGDQLIFVGTMRNHQDRRPKCKGKGYYVKKPSE